MCKTFCKRWMLSAIAVVTVGALAAMPASLVVAQEAVPEKCLALVVGINGYDHSKFRNLDYAENDAKELAKTLVDHYYDVSLMVGEETTLENIRRALKRITTKRNRRELVLVAFAGHGLNFADQKGSYFCPKDAEPADPTSMLPLAEIYNALAECGAGAKFLLVDACREEAVRGAPRKAGIDSALRAPDGVGVLFSCSPGQFAFEANEYKHGIFFYHVLKGLRGKAAAREDDGFVTWDNLRGYVKRNVAKDVARMFPGGKQIPNEVSNLSEVPPLLKINKLAEQVPTGPVRLTGIWSGRYIYPDGDGRDPVDFNLNVKHQDRTVTASSKEPNTFWQTDPKIDKNEPYLFANFKGTFDDATGRVSLVKTYDGTAGANGVVEYVGFLRQNNTKIEGTWTIRTPGRPDFSGQFLLQKRSLD